MNCTFQITDSTAVNGKQEYSCTACGRTHWSKYTPDKIRRNCTSDSTCQYRGDTLRLVECPSCKGKIQVKVLKCTLFECCQLGTKIEGVRSCVGCESRISTVNLLS